MELYGPEHFAEMGKKGGRPTVEEANRKAYERLAGVTRGKERRIARALASPRQVVEIANEEENDAS